MLNEFNQFLALVEEDWYEFMTPDFGELLTMQDLADILAWMRLFE